MKAQIIRKHPPLPRLWRTRALVLAAGVLALGAGMAPAANDVAPAPASPMPSTPLPSGVADVLKLDQAKISDSTIVAYIQNSGNIYHLDAGQIIYLRNQGLSDAVLTAMVSTPGAIAGAADAQTPNDQTPDMNPPPPPDVNATGDTTSGAAPTIIYVNSAPVYYYPAWSFSWWWPVGVTWGWAWWGGCWHWGCNNSFGFRPCGFWNRGFHGFSGFHGGFNRGFTSVGFRGGFSSTRGFGSVSGFHTVNSGFRGVSSSSVVRFGGMSRGSVGGFSGGSVVHFSGGGGSVVHFSGGGRSVVHFSGGGRSGGSFGGGSGGGFHGGGGGGFGGGGGRGR